MISFFFFKQKTAYEMRISDWSSDVCSSDLVRRPDQSTRPTGRSARGVRCEPRDLASQNLSILPARLPGPRPRPRVIWDRAKTRGFVHARSMVFSPGQVRQKGCHFRGVDIIERAVDRKSTRLNSSH